MMSTNEMGEMNEMDIDEQNAKNGSSKNGVDSAIPERMQLSEYQKVNGINMSFSPCCDMFVITVNKQIICTGCKRVIKELNESENVIMRYKMNTSNGKTICPKVGCDDDDHETEKLKRYAVDETFELCDKQCPKCNSNSRYCRKHTGELVYICSNKDCRNVFD